MRRVLLALLALPASALAQSTGAIVANTSTINIAQCTGTPNTELGLNDTMTLSLLWSVTLNGTVAFNTNGLYRLYAANQQPAAGQGTGTSCTTPANSSTTSFVSGQVGSDLPAGAQTTTVPVGFNMSAVVAAAGFNCTDATTATVYLCVQWVNGGSPDGWATSTITLDRTTPSAPTLASVSGGDSTLYLNCSGSDATYKATATSLADSSVHFSSQLSSCGNLNVGGLTNGQEYSVVVYGMNSANNPSLASNSVVGTPVPTDDFWTLYKKDGGRDEGGCSSGGAAGLLGALALLRLKRRRP